MTKLNTNWADCVAISAGSKLALWKSSVHGAIEKNPCLCSNIKTWSPTQAHWFCCFCTTYTVLHVWFSEICQINCAFFFFQVDLINNISNIPQPFLYTRHVHFLNFTRYSRAPAAFVKYSCSANKLFSTYISICPCKVQDRAACLHQHYPGPHQPLPLQLLLPSLRWLAGGAEPPHPNTRDERWWEIPGETNVVKQELIIACALNRVVMDLRFTCFKLPFIFFFFFFGNSIFFIHTFSRYCHFDTTTIFIGLGI